MGFEWKGWWKEVCREGVGAPFAGLRDGRKGLMFMGRWGFWLACWDCERLVASLELIEDEGCLVGGGVDSEEYIYLSTYLQLPIPPYCSPTPSK